MPIDAPTPAMPPTQQQVAPAISAQAVLAPEPTDRWTALKMVGWWKPIDTTMLAALMAHIVTGFFFLVFGKLTMNVAIIGLLQMLVLLTAWGVLLIYRCMDFVLQLRANVEMMPFDSARIAVGYLQGGQPLNTPVPR